MSMTGEKSMVVRGMARIALVLALVATIAVSGCGASPSVREQPEASAGAESEYRIGPGDQLNVYVWNRPELSVNIPVRPDGNISTPLVENMVAVGKTPTQLARDMEKVLSEFVRSPTVNIIVTTFVGTYADQVRVVGQAANPQALPYRQGMSLLDVMIAVGGLGEFASGNRAKVVRRVDGKVVEMPVRIKDLVNDGDIRANMLMQPGDVLIIPESRF
jgi:polysaccharide biosynthesis/export protein